MAGKTKELPERMMLALEKDFRAGIMPWAAMQKKYGVSAGWLKKEGVEKRGWTRDLTEKIRQDADRKQQEQMAREQKRELPPDHRLTEKEVTDGAVELITAVTGTHRALLKQARELAATMLKSMEDGGQDVTPQSFKHLVDSIKTIIATEREVLKIGDDGEGSGAGALTKLMQRVMGTGFTPVPENTDAEQQGSGFEPVK